LRILVAEDDAVSRRLLESLLLKWGHKVVLTASGNEAWEILSAEHPPSFVILDWMMPGMDGSDICKRLRLRPSASPTYVILVTARNRKEDVVAGLEAGADDYVVKPFDREELRARVQVGQRVLRLQEALAQRVHELETALTQVTHLQGLLPICSYCKKIRDDKNYWQQVDVYVSLHSGAQFSHGICPDCYRKVRAQLG
jgi:DNA-binding response OmpR family regulator